MTDKRRVVKPENKGFTVQDLILIAVLIAAGAVLKLTVSSFLSFAGMKPNFMIAMYCLAIILTKPRVHQAIIIGLLVGLVSQIPLLNATPLVNFASEVMGALACCLLVQAFSRIAPANKGLQNMVFPAVITFLSTVVSGYSFAIIVGTGINGVPVLAVIALYAVMVLGTAVMNAAAVAVLAPVLKAVLKRPFEKRVMAPKNGEAAETKPEMGDGVIEIRDFSFQYREGSASVLHDINLSIPAGQFVGVTGAAGSGKSSLTYVMNGIVPHCYPGDFYGSVRVAGLDTCEASLTDISLVVGSVCQDIESQMVSSVVEDEMLYGLENFGVPKDEIEERVTQALEDMGIAGLRESSIAGLSGGQKQKVAISSILAMRPAVLVLDEPTAELDPASSYNVFSLLKQYAKEHGTTVVVVEQKIALLSDFVDRLLIVEDGAIRFDGTPEQVLEHSDELLEIGVACPRSTSLSNALRQLGLYDGPVCKNVSQAAAMCEEVLA